MAPYLSQWFVNEHGGSVPVRLVRGSVESKTLELFLTRRPEGVPVQAGGEGMTAIVIPSFRSRPAQTYNYLPPKARQALLSLVTSRFDVQLWNDLHRFGNIGKQQKELIYAWMEAHGMEPDARNWDAVAKRYQRLCDKYAARERAARHYEEKKKK